MASDSFYVIFLCRSIFLFLFIYTVKTYVQSLILQLNYWQILLLASEKFCNTSSTLTTFFSDLPICLHDSSSDLLLAFLPPVHQPKPFLPVTRSQSCPPHYLRLTPGSRQPATPAVNTFPTSAIKFFHMLPWDTRWVLREGIDLWIGCLVKSSGLLCPCHTDQYSHWYLVPQRTADEKTFSVLCLCNDFWLMCIPGSLIFI